MKWIKQLLKEYNFSFGITVTNIDMDSDERQNPPTVDEIRDIKRKAMEWLQEKVKLEAPKIEKYIKERNDTFGKEKFELWTPLLTSSFDWHKKVKIKKFFKEEERERTENELKKIDKEALAHLNRFNSIPNSTVITSIYFSRKHPTEIHIDNPFIEYYGYTAYLEYWNGKILGLRVDS